mgnify:CR=1 FL=1
MAITQTQALPAPFITALGEKYGTGLAGLADQPFTTAQLGQVAPQVAAQDPLQAQAATMAQQGLGAYQPYLTGAATAGAAPGAAPMGLEAYGTLGTAAGLTGPMTTAQTQAYMSPYQQSVIDATLGEYDIQAQQRQQAMQDATLGIPGAFGGGREGVQLAEYQTGSDRQRAALQAGLLQQGFGQAQQARQQDYMNQLGISQAQLGLGQYQAGLGATTQQLAGGDIGLAGQVGATNQAQAQAIADAQREANRMTLYEPYERLGFFGQGLTGLMGGYPAQYQSQIQPNPTPLQSALGIGSVLGGIYGNIRGRQT